MKKRNPIPKKLRPPRKPTKPIPLYMRQYWAKWAAYLKGMREKMPGYRKKPRKRKKRRVR